VRVTTLEDAVAALDHRTRVAQSLAIHGTVSQRAMSQFPVLPVTWGRRHRPVRQRLRDLAPTTTTRSKR